MEHKSRQKLIVREFCEKANMVWLIKRDRGRTFKPLFNKFSNLCYYFTSFNLSNASKFFGSWILKDCCFAKLLSLLRRAICIFITPRSTTNLWNKIRYLVTEASFFVVYVNKKLFYTDSHGSLVDSHGSHVNSHDSLTRWLTYYTLSYLTCCVTTVRGLYESETDLIQKKERKKVNL